jgi:hypothetical protein
VGNFELSLDDYVQDYFYICGPEYGISEFEEARNTNGEVQPIPSIQHGNKYLQSLILNSIKCIDVDDCCECCNISCSHYIMHYS